MHIKYFNTVTYTSDVAVLVNQCIMFIVRNDIDTNAREADYFEDKECFKIKYTNLRHVYIMKKYFRKWTW